MLQELGYQPKLVNAFHGVMIGYLINILVPRLGEISRGGIIQQSEDIPIDKGELNE